MPGPLLLKEQIMHVLLGVLNRGTVHDHWEEHGTDYSGQDR